MYEPLGDDGWRKEIKTCHPGQAHAVVDENDHHLNVAHAVEEGCLMTRKCGVINERGKKNHLIQALRPSL